MADENYADLIALMAVTRERSFTRAAAQLGVSPSALSHRLRGLEQRLGVRLLTRTTRRVAPTEAGERLVRTLTPRFAEIDLEVAAVSALRDRPAGTIRITANDHAVDSVLWPKLPPFLSAHPDIKVELVIDYGLADIVTQRYDAGIRSGEQVAGDMVAVRIGPDMRMAVVGSPAYFKKRPPPQSPKELTDHLCINLRLPTLGGLYPWEFERGGREIHVRVGGQLTFNMTRQMIQAAVDGFGLAYVPEDLIEAHLDRRRLERVLENWCPRFPGYHLYYPSSRQISPAFRLLVEALRYRRGSPK